MRDSVGRCHIRRSEFGRQLTSDQRLVGRIEWDPESDGRVPLAIIDTFEGFTLEARVKDTIELVGDVPSV
jgi:hypothetical protein